MTNEETAKQIARSLTVSDEYPHDYLSAYTAAMQAMAWKDEQLDEQWKRLLAESKSIGVILLQRKEEQYKKEKQQWIDKACEWIDNQSFCGMIEYPVDELIEEFKKTMKGE